MACQGGRNQLNSNSGIRMHTAPFRRRSVCLVLPIRDTTCFRYTAARSLPGRDTAIYTRTVPPLHDIHLPHLHPQPSRATQRCAVRRYAIAAAANAKAVRRYAIAAAANAKALVLTATGKRYALPAPCQPETASRSVALRPAVVAGTRPESSRRHVM